MHLLTPVSYHNRTTMGISEKPPISPMLCCSSLELDRQLPTHLAPDLNQCSKESCGIVSDSQGSGLENLTMLI